MEKRRKIRHSLKDLISILDSTTQSEIGKVQNISEDGFMLESEERIEINSTIHCLIRLPKPLKNKTEISFDAVAVWSRKNVQADRWEVGFYIETSESTKEILSYLILFLRLNHIESDKLNSFKTEESENQRISSRYEPEMKLAIYEKNSSQQVGALLDISQSGAKIVSANNHFTGENVEYRLKLPVRIFEKDYLLFKAKVMWSKKEDFVENYRVGMRFEQLNELDVNIILFLILHHCNPQKSMQRMRVVRR